MIEVLITTPGLVGLLLPLTLKEALWIVDVAIKNTGASINVFVCGISASKIWWKFSRQTSLEREEKDDSDGESFSLEGPSNENLYPCRHVQIPPRAETHSNVYAKYKSFTFFSWSQERLPVTPVPYH